MMKVSFLRNYGADNTLNTERTLPGGGAGNHRRQGFDYVFETAGQSPTMNIAFQIAAVKSSVCFIGNPHKDVVFDPVTWELMNRKEFRLTASWMSYSAPYPGREWPLVAHFLGRRIS